MDTLSSIIVFAVIILFIILLLKILAKPIHIAFKIIMNMIFGFLILVIVNIFGSIIGISLELTAVNALVTGCLGVPGVIVLILLEII